MQTGKLVDAVAANPTPGDVVFIRGRGFRTVIVVGQVGGQAVNYRQDDRPRSRWLADWQRWLKSLTLGMDVQIHMTPWEPPPP